MGVFHAKGWWPKTSCPPSKVCLPWVSKRGIWDIPGILPGCPGPLAVFKKFVQKKNFVRIFRSLKGAYSSRGRSRHLLEIAFSEPPSENPSQTLSHCKTHSRPPSQNPSENPFPRTLPSTFSEPFLERCVAVRPLRHAPNSTIVGLMPGSLFLKRLQEKLVVAILFDKATKAKGPTNRTIMIIVLGVFKFGL